MKWKDLTIGMVLALLFEVSAIRCGMSFVALAAYVGLGSPL